MRQKIAGRFLLVIIAFLLNGYSAAMVIQKSTGTIRGTISDKQGHPVADAHIIMQSTLYHAISDEQGRFVINGINSGTYTLVITRIGFESVKKRVTIKSGEVTRLSLRLEPKIYSSRTLVITATRTKKELEEVPVPITVIPEKEIKRSGNMRLSEVLAEQTGLMLTSDHGTGIQVQGFSSEYTLIMLNGQPLIGRTAGTFDLSRISVGNVEHIEMIKGPSSALWGSDALAGVINIITKDASSPFKMNVSSRYGTNRTLDVGSNISFSTGNWSNSIYLNRNSSEGYRLNPESISKTVPEYENYTLSYRTEWDISQTITAGLQTRFYHSLQQGIDFTESGNEITLLENNAVQEDYSFAPSIDIYPVQGLNLYFSYYGSQYRTDNRWNYRQYDSLYDRETFNQAYNKAEFKANYYWGESHISTAGSGMNWEKVKAARYAGNPLFTNFYAYAQHEWQLTEKLDFISGFRYDVHSEYSSQFSPKLSGRYKLTDWLHIRGSVGGGFKAPDFRQLLLNFTNPSVGYSVFGANTAFEQIRRLQNDGKIARLLLPLSKLSGEMKAERSWAYNLGIDINPLPDLRLRINAFNNDVENLIETAPVAVKNNGQSVFTYFNLDQIYTRGIEANLQWSPLPVLNLSAGYQLLVARRKIADMRTIQDANGEVIEKKFVSYKPMFNRSMHSGNIKLFVELQKYGLDANIRGTLRGKYGRFDSNGNGYVDSDEYTSGYTVWDAAVAKNFNHKYRLQVGVDNVLNFTRPGDLSWLSGRVFYVQASIDLY